MGSATTDREALRDAFRERFSRTPAFVVRAPGRVNLIGEHIDYNGLPVLPMAIPRAVRLAAAPRDDRTVRLISLTGQFGERSFPLDPPIPPYEQGDWGNYAKAAAQAIAHELDGAPGFDAVIASDLPVAAGLSSSSALVVAVALALLETAGRTLERVPLAGLLGAGERYVGTRGGGMDQAICLGAREGYAARVDFDPLRLVPLPVPDAWTVLVADSLQRAEKSGSARDTYNRRVTECQRALTAVNAELRLPSDTTYRDVTRRVPVRDLLEAGRRALDRTLFRRFRHVVGENERVVSAERALLDSDPWAFGRLLDASHESLRDDYEVSTERLDRLTSLMVEAGAYGARLTGAGLGGCAIGLCDSERAAAIVGALTRDFYRDLDTAPDGDPVLAVHPAGGAQVTRL